MILLAFVRRPTDPATAMRDFAAAIHEGFEADVRAAIKPRERLHGLSFRPDDPLNPCAPLTAIAVVDGVEIHGHGPDGFGAVADLVAVLEARYVAV